MRWSACCTASARGRAGAPWVAQDVRGRGFCPTSQEQLSCRCAMRLARPTPHGALIRTQARPTCVYGRQVRSKSYERRRSLNHMQRKLKPVFIRLSRRKKKRYPIFGLPLVQTPCRARRREAFVHLFEAFGQFDNDSWTSWRVLSRSVLTSNRRTWVWRER